MANSSSLITTSKITRSFQLSGVTVYALNDISLHIPKGKLTVLQGPSGSGKTTLINILGALDKPDSGSVLFEGKDIVTITDQQRDELRRLKMGFVFQSVALIGNMSASENLDFALRVAGFNAKERYNRVQECLSLVGLSSRTNHKPGELSGGEQQRVAIARAIAHKPSVLFADEPTAELDSHTGLQIIQLIKTFVEQYGSTVIMSSHDPFIVEIADNVIQIEDGYLSGEK